MGVLELFMTDFCPFAQRFWLAILEKEENPSAPTLFEYKEVNYFNPDLAATKEFLTVFNTVPCGRVDGEIKRESMPMAYWADETYPRNPLQPSTEEEREKMKKFITKYTSGENDLTGPFYNFLFLQPGEDDAAIAAASKAMLQRYATLSKEIEANKGPYVLGKNYTLADIALIPFVDRAILLLGHYKGFTVPQTPEFASFHAWRASYKARPAYKITNADRLPRSVAVQPFEKIKRDEYIIEMYASYANNVRTEVRAQLRNAPPGVATQDIPRALAEQKKERATEQAKLRHHRALAWGSVAVFVAVAVGKLVTWGKKSK